MHSTRIGRQRIPLVVVTRRLDQDRRRLHLSCRDDQHCHGRQNQSHRWDVFSGVGEVH
jgi:hypothetical protein